ncbi:hypothetical protein H4R99_000595 [Coemansia sp. RSA 1722]|nr:hypothetical protein LPJ57_000285 [Coemansia sp. RSA 486]KAJ2238042.1 hypothetical protein IWW45_000382 [Coemansia sp. RSA 485]KAJ2606200.1 hypothetical protein H4R99_000595 [Coemansia sp. RSA 1722]KAJ2639676.1 hypothetical protein GGF40_000642 [Coemansia sp. RSA 1286]
MVCTICYEPLFKQNGNNSSNKRGKCRNNKMPAALSCGHVFHGNCINRWLYSMGNFTCPLCNQEPFESPLKLYMELDEDDAVSIMPGGCIDQLVDQLGSLSMTAGYASTVNHDYGYICELNEGLRKAREENKRLKDQLDSRRNNENEMEDEINRLNRLSDKHRQSIRELQVAVGRRNDRIYELEYELYGDSDDDDEEEEEEDNYYYY